MRKFNPLVMEDMIEQCTDDSQRWFPSAQSLDFLALCLGGETGEVQNIIKKHVRGTLLMEDMMETLPEEIIDVLIYLCNLMGHEAFDNVDWHKIWNDKRAYNAMRFGEGQSSTGRSDIRDLADSMEETSCPHSYPNCDCNGEAL